MLFTAGMTYRLYGLDKFIDQIYEIAPLIVFGLVSIGIYMYVNIALFNLAMEEVK